MWPGLYGPYCSPGKIEDDILKVERRRAREGHHPALLIQHERRRCERACPTQRSPNGASVPACFTCFAAPAASVRAKLENFSASGIPGGSADPFAPECKIPLPVPYSPYDYWLEPTFIRRRNERERQRRIYFQVRHVNDGFERLRSRLPLPPRDKDRRLSKVETLRYAISYIRHLQRLLGLLDDDEDEDGENNRCR
ncbi:uncharacterized protein [Dermacentor andersoni]|uniref:uncharacterized protein isoform X3 n=1 Tax=Dermacentor andersoni TaxID=34620 RepID=UPI0024162936|nr:achaete-scute homolog 5-like isoform X3 [Dermacentor andersoni]